MPTWLATVRRLAQGGNALVLVIGAWSVTQGYTGPAIVAAVLAGLNLLALRRADATLGPRLAALIPAVLTVMYGCVNTGLALGAYAETREPAILLARALPGAVFFLAGSLTLFFFLALAQLTGVGRGNEPPTPPPPG